MGKVKQTVQQDFQAATERELDTLLATFKAEHEARTGERLAIDAKRPLGPGKVRMTFRVVAMARKR